MLRRILLFIAGMIGSLLILIVITLIVAHLRSDCGIVAVFGRLGVMRSYCADDIIRVGFPLLFWEEGGLAYRSIFSISALLANTAIALGISCVVGWLFQRTQNQGNKPPM